MLRRASRRTRGPHPDLERGRQAAGSLDRLALRKTANSSRGDRTGRWAGGAEAPRALATATYRSAVEFELRFGGAPVPEDQLVPFYDMQALAARPNGPRRLIEINSVFGHDAFLKEGAALTPTIRQVIAEHST